MKAYCINLKRRPDRREFMSRQFERLGLRPQWFDAVDGLDLSPEQAGDHRPGGIACSLSHLGVIRDARLHDHPSVLIFEDDAVLCRDFNERLALFLSLAPQDWDMLFLGISFLRDPVEPGRHVHRLVDGYAAHAYVVRRPMYDAIIGAMGDRPTKEPDDYYREMFASRRCYVFIPYLSYQRDDWSDIRMTFRDDRDRFSNLYADNLLL